jgi:hypothetical protein
MSNKIVTGHDRCSRNAARIRARIRAWPRRNLVAPPDTVAYARAVSIMFHVSSVRNRSSIQSHGLDASRMGAAPGIAGSSRPEADGIFLCDDAFTADFFIRMNNTSGPVDVWQVDGVDADQMLDNGTGFFYVPGRISADRITLVERDLAGGDHRRHDSGASAIIQPR